jgi:iron(III) transport system ATP-binding protein
MSLLELINVSRHFGDVQAVKGISFNVQQGQFLTLLGPSGCGKTTTLRLIAGFEVPDGGIIRFKNRTFADKNTFVPPKDRQIGMVFQDYALFPHLNVAQNVGFGLLSDKRKTVARVAEMLELVGLRGFDERMPFELSGGQQQRVALARALAPEPGVLLLDEPFSSLDAALRAQVRSEMRAILRQTRTTCIFVTHSQDEALSLSDQVGVMFEGRVAQIATPETLYERPATLDVATFVGEANLIPGEAYGEHAESALGQVALVEPASGRVTLLIRPEFVQIADAQSEGVSAQILWSEYYGHDRRIGLKLANGTQITARVAVSQPVRPGDTLRVNVQTRVRAYP